MTYQTVRVDLPGRAYDILIGAGLLAAWVLTQVLNGRYLPRGGEPVEAPAQLGPVSISLQLAPPPTPSAIPGELGDGTSVVYPAVGGNCYDIFPLCLIPGSGTNVRSRGDRIADGFAVQSDGR